MDTFNDEVLTIVLGFLTPEDLMRSRVVCSNWREAVTKTIVPNVKINSDEKYNALVAMARALPNLQHVSLCKHEDGGYFINSFYAGRTSRRWHPCFRDAHKYADGISPDETEAARTATIPPTILKLFPDSEICAACKLITKLH